MPTAGRAIAATVCGLLVFLGWLTLQWGWLGVSLLILPAAYVVGGFESTSEGLTTLFKERELDVDLFKTGTLTTGKPQVVKVVSATGSEDR